MNAGSVPARENAGLELTDGYEAVATAEVMFETIRNACEAGNRVVVDYDKELGFPRFFAFSKPSGGPDNGDSYKVERIDLEP